MCSNLEMKESSWNTEIVIESEVLVMDTSFPICVVMLADILNDLIKFESSFIP